MFLIGANLGYYVNLAITTLISPYLHEYNISIIARGKVSVPCMHDLRRTSLSPIEPADKRASRAIAHSIIRPRKNKVFRLGTGRETETVHSRHRVQVRLTNAISGPGTAQPVYKEVRELPFGRSRLMLGRPRKDNEGDEEFILRMTQT